MNSGLMEQSEAIKADLISLRGKLRAEQQVLLDVNARYEQLCRAAAMGNEDAALEAAVLPQQAETIKAKIRGLELIISEKETAKASLDNAAFAEFQRVHEETERAEKLKRWRTLNSQCSAARKELEDTVAPLKEAQAAVDEQAAAIQHARDALSNHVEAKPRFATDQELAAWSTELTELEVAVRNAFAEMRRLDDIRTAVIQRQVQARAKFERLVFQVRMAQPPEGPLPKSQLTAR
jgi:chromosome segregation ATPase